MMLAGKRRLPMLAAPRGTFVVYRGPSALDGSPIIAVLTGADGSSKNPKTGPMAQLYILPADISPSEAQRSGADAAVCGDCPLRPITAKANGTTECYVLAYQAPQSTWRSNRDRPVDLAPALAQVTRSGVAVRLGAYGDPAALPQALVAALHAASDGNVTGYTHQWRRPEMGWLRRYTMASCDAPHDYARAVAEGWRTYRVIAEGAPLAKKEIACPSEIGVTCARCGLCDGIRAGSGRVDKRKNIAIVAH